MEHKSKLLTRFGATALALVMTFTLMLAAAFAASGSYTQVNLTNAEAASYESQLYTLVNGSYEAVTITQGGVTAYVGNDGNTYSSDQVSATWTDAGGNTWSCIDYSTSTAYDYYVTSTLHTFTRSTSGTIAKHYYYTEDGNTDNSSYSSTILSAANARTYFCTWVTDTYGSSYVGDCRNNGDNYYAAAYIPIVSTTTSTAYIYTYASGSVTSTGADNTADLTLYTYEADAEAKSGEFTVATINVDGLPESVLGGIITMNSDGPGSDGTKWISSYIDGCGYDIVAVQEDFEYNAELLSNLTNYSSGTWRGNISDNISLSLLYTGCIDTDGLNLLYKSAYTTSGETWVSWTTKNGRLDNGNDELIDKGYRFYQVTIADGVTIDVYTMHMDADSDAEDIAAREAQWTQLVKAIKASDTTNPIIVMGDTNSRYTREDLQTLVIDALEADSRFTVADAWIEVIRDGDYPEYGSAALTVTEGDYNSYQVNEVVDKVLYINNANSNIQLTATSYEVDEDGYQYDDGSLPGDHPPVVVEFSYTEKEIETPTHEHSYEQTDYTAPTCTENGSVTYTCSSCGESYTEAVPYTGHSYGEPTFTWTEDYSSCTAAFTCSVCNGTETVECEVSSETTAATCTEAGKTIYTATCTFSGTEYTDTKTVAIEATGHTAGEAVKENEVAATCTEDGSYDSVVYCTVCGEEISRETITVSATGHTEGETVTENEVAATCTEDGSYDSVVYCTVCGEEISRETVTVPATGHSYEAAVTEPTCTEGGYTTYTCTVCGDSYVANETEATGHTWDEGVVTTAATCTEDGVKTYTCTVCGETKTETIEATGHTAGEAVKENEVAATCTKDGSYDNVVYCTVCGEEISRETVTVSATGHSYEAVVTEPTCTEGGYTTYTCTVCGDSYTADETEATGHTWDEGVVTKEATCTEDGVKTYTCTVCGATKTEAIKATGHSYVAVVTEPTCTEGGYTTYTCSVCGDSYIADKTEATGHTTEIRNAKAATCTENGYTGDEVCTVCGETVKTGETIPATGHTWDDGVVTTAATCTEAGVKTYTCTVCGETKTEAITATGHTAGEAVKENEVAATCTTDGSYDSVVYCSVCGEELSRETVTVEATGHTVVTDAAVAATCTETGLTEGSHCSVCGEVIVAQEEIPALGHTWDDGEVTTAATCTTEGVKTYTCTVCGETKTEAIAATGHTAGEAVKENEVAATCTKDGSYDNVVYCTVCGEEISRETVTVSATGHSYEAVVTEPTCTEGGYTTYTCTVCGDSYTADETEATGHTWDEGVVTKEATCTEDGVKTYTCTVCGATKTEAIKATGHSYVAVVTEPTCTEGGYTTYTCSVCGDSYVADKTEATGHTTEIRNAKAATCTEAGYTGDEVCTVCGETVTAGEVIPATGHTWGEGVVTTAATCTEDGVMTYTCTVCGETKTEAITATGHTAGEAVKENEVAATCTKDGSYDSVVYCSVCGAEISRETITVPATGHTEGEAVIENEVAATCTTDGSYDSVVYCSVCGEELSRETVTVSATGHSYEAVVTEPTCTEGGYTIYTCSVCGDSYVADETEATGHTWDDGVVTEEATCTAEGVLTYTCTVCGETKTEAITATGHTAGEAVIENEVAATCTTDGSYDSVVYCTVCGEEISRETVTVSATGHSYEAVVTAPTCTEGGYTTYTCTVCGDSYVADETEAAGHTWDEGVVTKEATCTEDGVKTYTCTVCGATKTEAIKATGHSYVAVVTEPTCTECGYTTYTCSVCGDSYTADETEAIGHTWDDGVVTTAATCTEDGVMTYTCTVCGETKTEAITATGHTAGEAVTENEVAATCTTDGSYDSVVYCSVCDEELSRETVTVPATGHSYEAVVTAPTCTEKGYTTYTCSACGDSYTADETAATGHSYTSKVTKEATCTENGEMTYTCSACGDTYTETISATGHSYVSVVTVPTCTEKGYTTYTCSACGDSYVSDYVDALGHSYDEGIVTKAATCTEEGVMTYTCTVCGDTKTEAIAATGHTAGEAVTEKVVAATCTTAGSYDSVVYCTVCGAEISRETVTVPATGHSYEAVVTAPTCTEKGYTTYTCSACGDSYVSDYVDALGHSYDEGVVTKAATCTEEGVMTYTCTVCGDTKTEAIAATGHTAGEAVTENNVAATCTKDGSYDSVVYCTVCGAEISRETVTVPATGHSYVAVVTAPTCTEKGYTTYTCSVCGDSYIADKTEATGHTTEIRNAKAATCTEDGYTGDEVCTVCGETISTGKVIAAAGHSYGEPTFTWAEDNSTCAAVFTCETCGDKQTISCTVTSETTAATYATDGKTVYTATVTFGDETYTDTKTVTIPATGEHSWNDGIVTKEATCTETGVKTYTCTVCGETKTEEIPATGHTVVTDAAVAATCTETGLTEGSHCSVCGEVIVAQETIAALGHTWNDGEATSDATATEDGEITYTCTVCGETKTDVIPATGHTYGVPTFTWADDYSTCVAAFACLDEGCGEVYEVTCIVTSETTDATCTEDGETVYTATCTFGDETYTGTQTVAIEAKGHTWNDGEVVSSATSTKDGEMTYTCTVCGETKTEVIPATGSSGGGSSSGGSSSSSGSGSSSSGGSATTDDTAAEDTTTKHDCPSEPYTDVDTTLWYHEYIDYVIENGLMIGISSDTFMPNIPTTRGMIVTILYRIENEPEVDGSSEFTDVADGEWYTKAIIWAEQNGIVLGYGNGKYGPNDDLNREQIAAILYRYAAYKEYDTTRGGMAIREFDDYGDISEYALEAMAWCINDGIIQGVGETTLVPQGDASRAQVAAILMRFLDLYT